METQKSNVHIWGNESLAEAHIEPEEVSGDLSALIELAFEEVENHIKRQLEMAN